MVSWSPLHRDVYHQSTCLPAFLRAFPQLYRATAGQQQQQHEDSRIACIQSTLHPILDSIRGVCELEFSPQHDPWSQHAFFAVPCMVASRSNARAAVRHSFRWSGQSFTSRRVVGNVGRKSALRSQYLQVRLKPGIWEYAHRLMLWSTKGMPCLGDLWSSPDKGIGGPGGRRLLPVTLHLCRRPSCQQPQHLTWGTTQENMCGPTNRFVKARGRRFLNKNKEREVASAKARMLTEPSQ